MDTNSSTLTERKFNIYDSTGKKLNEGAVPESQLEKTKTLLNESTGKSVSEFTVRELLNG